MLIEIGFKPGGSCKFTFTHKQYTKQHNDTEYNTYITIKIHKYKIRIHKHHHHKHHHHKHQLLDPLIRSRLQRYSCSRQRFSVFQVFSFLVVCSGMISKGFGFVAFFAVLKF